MKSNLPKKIVVETGFLSFKWLIYNCYSFIEQLVRVKAQKTGIVGKVPFTPYVRRNNQPMKEKRKKKRKEERKKDRKKGRKEAG